MKKWLLLIFCILALAGCAGEETMETVSDEIIQSVMAEKREILLTLPEDAAAPVGEGGEVLYQCDGYEIMVHTFPAGDLHATVQSVSGYEPDQVTLLEIQREGCREYSLVWVSAGELGDRVGRALILDDGQYHYAVSVLGDADCSGQWEGQWRDIFASVTLG